MRPGSGGHQLPFALSPFDLSPQAYGALDWPPVTYVHGGLISKTDGVEGAERLPGFRQDRVLHVLRVGVDFNPCHTSTPWMGRSEQGG